MMADQAMTHLEDGGVRVHVRHEAKEIVDAVEENPCTVAHQRAAVEVVTHWNLNGGGGGGPILH